MSTRKYQTLSTFLIFIIQRNSPYLCGEKDTRTLPGIVYRGKTVDFVDFLLTIAPRFHNKAGSLIIYAIMTFQGAIQSPIKGLLYINRYDTPLTLA